MPGLATLGTQGTAPGGAKGAELVLGQSSWDEALVEEQQRAVLEGQGLVSLTAGRQGPKQTAVSGP